MSNYPIFSVLGIEIEYMLVDKNTLSVRPMSDVILKILAGKQVNEVALGDIAISNELVMHVLELKNNGPKPPTYPTAQKFQQTILELQPLLEQHQLQLLPTGAHPWMNPLTETIRWPHGDKSIYQQFDKIFNCQGHGWANLQSMHVNLPFANDDEFFHLHSAIRILLPILPALAASTPFLNGKPTGFLSSRLNFYQKNQQRIPSIGKDIIPEFIQSQQDYQTTILQPMYRDIHPHDPERILQHEWLNSRAAIAKFEPMCIEIRILDAQECVNADIAIAKLIQAILKSWHTDSSQLYLKKPLATKQLKTIYDATIKKGLDVFVTDSDLLAQWQLPKKTITVRDVWSLLIERVYSDLDHASQCALEYILQQGNLSERLLRAYQQKMNREQLTHIYQQLGGCLLKNKQFSAS